VLVSREHETLVVPILDNNGEYGYDYGYSKYILVLNGRAFDLSFWRRLLVEPSFFLDMFSQLKNVTIKDTSGD